MGVFDKAKEAMSNNPDKVDQGIDKAEETAKGRFGEHSDQIDKGADKAREYVDRQDGQQGQGQ